MLARQRQHRETHREEVNSSRRRLRGKYRAREIAYRSSHSEMYAACSRGYRLRHLDKVVAANRRWRDAHRDELLAKKRAYYQANVERLTARKRTNYIEHREKICAERRRYRETHRERVAAAKHLYGQTHRDVIRASGHRRHAREVGSGGRYSISDWLALCGSWGNKCLCCGAGERLTADHVIPLACGGRNEIDNLQLLCKVCNSRKGIKSTDYRPSKES